MSDSPVTEILVVDDDDGLRASLTLLLQASGYVVTTASNGFEALLRLKEKIPALVLSDLNMPEMSGFELLSVVRRRFPQVSVVAMSGAFETADAVPGGAIADAFYPKGRSNPGRLLRMIADLIQNAGANSIIRRRESAPVWIPRTENSSGSVPYVVITCPDCLRSFPSNVVQDKLQKINETACLFCPNIVRYIVDFSAATVSPQSALDPMQENLVQAAIASGA